MKFKDRIRPSRAAFVVWILFVALGVLGLAVGLFRIASESECPGGLAVVSSVLIFIGIWYMLQTEEGRIALVQFNEASTTTTAEVLLCWFREEGKGDWNLSQHGSLIYGAVP